MNKIFLGIPESQQYHLKKKFDYKWDSDGIKYEEFSGFENCQISKIEDLSRDITTGFYSNTIPYIKKYIRLSGLEYDQETVEKTLILELALGKC